MADILSADVAVQKILAEIDALPVQEVTLAQALGRILAQNIEADIDLPPFANSSMDGYAVRATDIQAATTYSPVQLRVVADIPAGSTPTTPVNAGEAARIMTGAPLPPGADAVIPVEQTDSTWRGGDDNPLPAHVAVLRAVEAGAYVRPVGEDIQRGQIVLHAGTYLRPQDIGMLAALGQAQVPVVRQPRVAIISTGDELVEPDQPLAPGKIRDVNRYTVAGLVQQYGGIAVPLPIARDTLDAVRAVFAAALAEEPDIIISTAGVSVGTYDVVRAVLDELGEVNFWRVNVRPGKPLAYGKLQDKPFFGLPGNPVSAMVTFDLFVRPALLKMLHQPDTASMITAITGEELHSDGRRSYIRVRLTRQESQLIAHTTGTQSSGALMSMVLADGLLIIPEDVTFVAAGTQLPVRLLRSIE